MINNLYVISALLGNWWGESHINPGIWEGLRVGAPGYGLGQWTDNSQTKRRTALTNWLRWNGYAADSAEGQIKYFMAENVWYSVRHAKDFKHLSDFLYSGSTDIEYLTYAFLEGWEGIWDGTQQNRLNHARTIFSYLQNHLNDGGEWITGNRYLSDSEVLHNAVLAANIFMGGGKVTYYISNCGGDERGQLHGGQAGDQSGTEWAVKPISAYHSTWTHVFRYPDADVRKTIADIAVEAANNNLVGYDQDERTTFYDHLKASNWRPSQITVACEADCSAGVAACVIAAGHLTGVNALASISPDMYTGNEIDTLTAAGFRQVPEAVDDPSKALRGDIYLNLGHHTAIFVGTNADGSENIKGGNRIMFEFSTVKPGDKGVDVLLLQEILKSRVNGDTGKPFYEGPLDQIYDIGMGLESGVNAYQDQREKDGVHIGTNGSHDSICGRAMWQDLLGKASV